MFDPRGSLRWKPFIEQVVDEFLTAMAPHGTAEYVESFALPLPVRVIRHIMGFPGDDLLSLLLEARFADERPLSDHEIITIVDHLYIGGNETTTFALTSALWLLLREPGLYEHIRYGAANRDERMFPDPDRVDLERRNVRRHMAFSLGEHHCPGSGLSRLEQQVALNAVLDRLPDLRLAPQRNDVRHLPGFVLRALERLHLEWGPTA